jgi:hypothetical protein
VKTCPSVLLGVSLAFAAACATAGPDFEQNFFAANRTTHDAWYRLLGTRYECDTVLVRNSQRVAAGTMVVETPVCTAAAFVTPDRIRAWHDSSGVREDWEFPGGAARTAVTSILGPPTARVTVGRCLLRLEGARPTTLRVTMLRC